MEKKCFQCDEKATSNLYDYPICESCKSNMKFFTDEKIKEHIELYKDSKKPRSYVDEIKYRLDLMEKDHIKKRIKLLNMLERAEQM